MNKPNVLIACEESQAVTIEMRKLGINAFSCDIIECSGGHPEWHIMQDVIPLLNGNCKFKTIDGKEHSINGKWNMIIAHPPCTFLSCAGNGYLNVEKYGEDAIKRKQNQLEAAEFFMKFINADCEKVAVENPVGYMNGHYRKPDQTIHPYFFAENENDTANYHKKRTCLWLKGLIPLERNTYLDEPKPIYVDKKTGKRRFYEGFLGLRVDCKDKYRVDSDEKRKLKQFVGV